MKTLGMFARRHGNAGKEQQTIRHSDEQKKGIT